MTRLEEIEARMAEINAEIENADEARMAELNAEVDGLVAERKAIEEKQQLRSKVAAGSVPMQTVQSAAKADDKREARAKKLVSDGRMKLDAAEARSILVSGGTIATPTGASGIHEQVGPHYSSIVDLVRVVDCEGMSANKVAYEIDASAASAQTEGNAGSDNEPTFGYVTIQPTSIATVSKISKQVRRQSPLNYEARVTEQSGFALRKKAAALIAAAMKASTLVEKVNCTKSSNKGTVDDKTLRNLVLAYGGSEGAYGDAVLFLNKTDLIALGDIRGTNEKKPVYEIIPDGGNPNMGIIRDGGLAVRYCLCSGLTACAGTSHGAADIPTMFYGNPWNVELDLFSGYEVYISRDFAITSLVDTIVGDAEVGADVVAYKGFSTLIIPHS